MRTTQKIFIVVLVLVTLVALSPLKTMRNLGRSWKTVIREVRSNALLTEVRKSRAGEHEALPPKVLGMLSLLRSGNITIYRYAPRKHENIGKEERYGDLVEYQRLMEGAWPAMLDPRASHLLQHSADPLPRECEPVSETRGVILARCP